jgi:hypothetical protein
MEFPVADVGGNAAVAKKSCQNILLRLVSKGLRGPTGDIGIGLLNNDHKVAAGNIQSVAGG